MLKAQKYELVIAIFLVSIAFGQMTMSSWRTFEDNPNLLKTENSKFQDYISKTYRDSIPEDQRSEYKAYLRYMYFWQRRLGQYDDEVLSYQPYYEAALDFSQNPICTSTDLADWELLGPHSTTSQSLGLITEVLYDSENPNVPLISSNHGGLWKFNPNTDKWENVTDNMRLPGISATEIVRHPFYHDIIFASTGNGIFNTKYGIGIIKSIDNGDNWTVMNGFPHADAPRVPKIIIDPNDNNPNDSLNMYAITNDKVYYTDDSGESWSPLPQQPILNEYTHLLDIEIDRQGDILVSTESLYSYNAQCFKYSGGTWSEILSIVDTITIKRCQFSSPVIGYPLLNDLVFAMIDMVKDTTYDSEGNEIYNPIRNIYRSFNNGTTWSLYKEEVLGVSAKCEIVFSPTTQFLYMGEINKKGINYATGQDLSMFGGDSFHADVRDIEIIGDDGDSEYSLWANDGGVSMIRVKLDGSSTQSSTNLNGSSLPVCNLIGLGVGTNNFIVTGAMHCQTFKKSENGEFVRFDFGDGGDCVVNPYDNSSYYYQANSAFKSSKYGTIYDGDGNDDWFIGGPYEINKKYSNQVYFGRIGKMGIFNESTNETTLKPMPKINGISAPSEVGSIEVSNNHTVYVSDFNSNSKTMSNRIIKSTDDGDSWQDLSQNNVQYVHEGVVVNKPLRVAMAWKNINTIESNPLDTDHLWIGLGGIPTENGAVKNSKLRVIKTTNNGTNWVDFSEGLPAFPVNKINGVSVQYP